MEAIKTEELKKITIGLQNDVRNQLANFGRVVDVMRDDMNYTRSTISRLESEIKIIKEYSAFKANLRQLIYKQTEKFNVESDEYLELKTLEKLCEKYQII